MVHGQAKTILLQLSDLCNFFTPSQFANMTHTGLGGLGSLGLLPDAAARLEILHVHARRTHIANAEQVLPRVAEATAGFSGAELANLVNEAAIAAVRGGRDEASHNDEP